MPAEAPTSGLSSIVYRGLSISALLTVCLIINYKKCDGAALIIYQKLHNFPDN